MTAITHVNNKIIKGSGQSIYGQNTLYTIENVRSCDVKKWIDVGRDSEYFLWQKVKI